MNDSIRKRTSRKAYCTTLCSYKVKKRKVLLLINFWRKIFHVKPSIVSSGSTMTQTDYLMEMMGISCYSRKTKMLSFVLLSFVTSFTMN